MTDVHKELHIAADEHPASGGSTLIEASKTLLRLAPRQINDEIDLAKLELADKKSRIGGVAISAVLALVLLFLLVVAMVVAAIAGLATLMPLWLSALVVCAALILVMGVVALVGVKRVKALMPLVPENAWRGVRHDLGIVKEGRAFDPSTLEAKQLSREERKAAKAESAAAKEKASAERAAKEAENGPKATAGELVQRTAARREHLLSLREQLLEEADVKKQASFLMDTARDKARESVNQAAAGAVGHAVQTARERWKPLAVCALSATVALVLLRKLLRK